MEWGGVDPAFANSGGRNQWTWRWHGRHALRGLLLFLMTKRSKRWRWECTLRVFYCGRTLILLRAASRLGESTGLWVDTPSWQRLSQPVSEYTHTHIFRYSFFHILIETDPIMCIKFVERCENVHQYELKYSILYNESKRRNSRYRRQWYSQWLSGIQCFIKAIIWNWHTHIFMKGL